MGRCISSVRVICLATGKSGILNVPEWLATANKTTQVDFFGGPRRPGAEGLSAGERRQELFMQWIGQGLDPRQALAKLLSRDSEVVRRQKPYRFIKKALSAQ